MKEEKELEVIEVWKPQIWENSTWWDRWRHKAEILGVKGAKRVRKRLFVLVDDIVIAQQFGIIYSDTTEIEIEPGQWDI